jgi:hypothetical protein
VDAGSSKALPTTNFFECTLVILYLINHLEKFAVVFGGHIIPMNIAYEKRRDLRLTP